MNRRGFLQTCLASSIAPYVITTAGVLMPVRKIWTAESAGVSLVADIDWFNGNVWNGAEWVFHEGGPIQLYWQKKEEIIVSRGLRDDHGRLKAQLRAAFDKIA